MTTLDQIVTQIKQATDYQTNKQILREKINADLHLVHNGGLFYVDQTLISFLSSWPHNDVYLEDVHENPIQVDKEELLEKAIECYQLVMNRWHNEHAELQRARKL